MLNSKPKHYIKSIQFKRKYVYMELTGRRKLRIERNRFSFIATVKAPEFRPIRYLGGDHE